MKPKVPISRIVVAVAACCVLSAGAFFYTGCFPPRVSIPAALETITALDGTTWERVTTAGLGNDNNMSVVALHAYKGRLYATTRNDVQGCEVWRTAGDGWEQVLVANGATNGVYGNRLINNVWARMVVFQDKLYVGFSCGVQGTLLNSTGCEIWCFDGRKWKPVVSDTKDIDESGTLTEISGCENNDGDTTALFSDASKNWEEDQWAGGSLQITSGDGQYRRFDIVSNTADTLVVQQNEAAGDLNESTVCDSQKLSNPFPVYSYTIGAVQTGDTYEIGMGTDESGFGEYWNKTVTAMVIHDGKLYVSTGLNYEYGAQVWYSGDGENWTVTQPAHSFGKYHNDANYSNGKKAVSSSITDLCVSSVSGQPVLYAGGTGTSGDQGRCSRLAKLTAGGWEMIVDPDVDANDTGTNENGFGDGAACDMFTGNFMPWDIIDFDNKLFAGINSLGGIRVMYTPNGSSEDGNWFYSVGDGTDYPNGFDGVTIQSPGSVFDGTYINIAPNMFVFNDEMYVGIVQSFESEDSLAGSQLWKTPDGMTWTQITDNGFGDSRIIAFEGFADFDGTLYVAGSKASATSAPLGGAKVYRLVQ